MNQDDGALHHQAELDLQQMIHESLDACFRAGAPKDELKFLAWQAGCGDWSPAPNVIQLNAHH